MIRVATQDDLSALSVFVKSLTAMPDNQKRFFLKTVTFSPCIYIAVNDDVITGLAHVNDKVLNLHGKRLKVSYITHAYLDDDAYMGLIGLLEREDIVTLVQSNDSELMEALGFESVIESADSNFSPEFLPKGSVEGIVLNPSPQKLVHAYTNFTKHFTGFFERNQTYYETLQSVSGPYVNVVGFEHDHELVGYIIYELYDNNIVVRECCYQTSGQLVAMLAFAARGKHRIVVQTSIYEHLERIIPNLKKSKHKFMYAMIHDKPLFEQLFHIKIISAYSGFNAFGKALWNRDIL